MERAKASKLADEMKLTFEEKIFTPTVLRAWFIDNIAHMKKKISGGKEEKLEE